MNELLDHGRWCFKCLHYSSRVLSSLLCQSGYEWQIHGSWWEWCNEIRLVWSIPTRPVGREAFDVQRYFMEMDRLQWVYTVIWTPNSLPTELHTIFVPEKERSMPDRSILQWFDDRTKWRGTGAYPITWGCRPCQWSTKDDLTLDHFDKFSFQMVPTSPRKDLTPWARVFYAKTWFFSTCCRIVAQDGCLYRSYEPY